MGSCKQRTEFVAWLYVAHVYVYVYVSALERQRENSADQTSTTNHPNGTECYTFFPYCHKILNETNEIMVCFHDYELLFV